MPMKITRANRNTARQCIHCENSRSLRVAVQFCSNFLSDLRPVFILCALFGILSVSLVAYGSEPTPPLRVSGRYLVTYSGKRVTLHGWYQPAQSYFNGGGVNYKDPTDYTNLAQVAPALAYLDNEADILSGQSSTAACSQGWYSTFVRVNGSPNDFAPGWDRKTGELTNLSQFHGWLRNFMVPYIDHCRTDGLYVVILGLPSEVYPGGDHTENMTQQYQNNLVTFWKTVANFPGIKNAVNVQFEICNEPIKIESKFGKNDWGEGDAPHLTALSRFMQVITDSIRSQGSKNIVWVPGLGYQSEYQGFVKNPVHGINVGYAAHIYPAYGGINDDRAAVLKFWNTRYKPCADRFPLIITELWWQAYTPEQLKNNAYLNLFHGTTGDKLGGFGRAIKDAIDAEGNVSYLIGFSSDLLSNLEKSQGGLNWDAVSVANSYGAQAAYSWFARYAAHTPSSSNTAVKHTPKLRVRGRYLQDRSGHSVTLHGWWQPIDSYFNGGGVNYKDPNDWNNLSEVSPVLDYQNSVADVLTNRSPLYGYKHGWYCNLVRLTGYRCPGWDYTTGELSRPAQFLGYLRNFVVPYIKNCKKHGVYVVIVGNPTGQDQGANYGDNSKNMTQRYQTSLLKYWQIVSNFPGIKSVSNVQFEICNEPNKIETQFGNLKWGNGDDAHYLALQRFMQPIVNTIRSQNADNVIWIPSLADQQQNSSFVKYPIRGQNIGYAAHIYPGYVSGANHNGDANIPSNFRGIWRFEYEQCSRLYPVMVTESWWTLRTAKQLVGDPYSNLFNGITGNVNYGYGMSLKQAFDDAGNVSYVIGTSSDLLGDVAHGLDETSLSQSDGSRAAFDWFPTYSQPR